MDKFPLDFLIVGTMKSGTSSLGYYVSQSPEVGIPEKEGHFFDRHFENGLEWYKAFLLSEKTSVTKIFGEKTPAYAWSETYAKQIKEINPKTKIIWIFRNPVDRAFSHYLHNYKSGLEYLSFDKALSKEPKRIKKDINLGYKWASLYKDQVEAFLNHFPKEQMFYILFEDLKKDGLTEVNKLFEFFEVSRLEKLDATPKNKTVIPKFPYLRYLVRKNFGRGSKIWNLTYGLTAQPDGVSGEIPKISEATAQRLKSEFEPYNRELEKIIGREITHW